MINRALRQWRAGEPSVGVWLSLGDPQSAEVIASMGFDWLCVDLQHGFMDAADLSTILAATATSSTTPMVRVASNAFDQIGKALDAGAQGVIVPMVDNAEEAKRAADACRYPPRGRRSGGPVRGVADMEDYVASPREIACIVMIETVDGLANVAEIAATPGVDAVFIGPGDLCFALGLPSASFDAPEFRDAIASILKACGEANKPAGIFGYTAELASDYLQVGFVFASVGTDLGFAREGAVRALAAAQTQKR